MDSAFLCDLGVGWSGYWMGGVIEGFCILERFCVLNGFDILDKLSLPSKPCVSYRKCVFNSLYINFLGRNEKLIQFM